MSSEYYDSMRTSHFPNTCTRLVLGLFLNVRHADESIVGESDMTGFIQCLESTRRNIPTNPNDWLRPEPHITYRYEGSLTTEPYTDNVIWIVFQRSKAVGKRLYRAIFQDTCLMYGKYSRSIGNLS